MPYTNLLLEKKEGIAKITINRPQVKNALDGPTFSELTAVFNEVEQDDGVGVAVIAGAGGSFSAGADFKFLGEIRDKGIKKPGVHLDDVLDVIEKMNKPVIASVQGYCLTGALELILACDMIIAAENALMGDTHARFGLVISGGGTQRLARIVGAMKAKEMLFTCRLLTAREAEKIGLVNKVVEIEKLDETVEQVAREIIANSGPAIGVLKACVNKGMKVDLATGLKLEKELAAAFTYPDRDERFKAFALRDRKKT